MLLALMVLGQKTLMAHQNENGVSIRVTRLGEFSPVGQLFSLEKNVKITAVAQNFGLPFSRGAN
jgi:hypothetical protein